MSFITPRERLKVDSMADAEQMARLPVTVIIQEMEENREVARAYLVENENFKAYEGLLGGDRFTPTEKIEEIASRVGKPIELNAFKEATAYDLCCWHPPDGSAWSIYATEFKKAPHKITSVD